MEAFFDEEGGDAQAGVLAQPLLDGVGHGGIGVKIVDAAHPQRTKDLGGVFRQELRVRRGVHRGAKTIDQQERRVTRLPLSGAGVKVKLPRLFFGGHVCQQVLNPLLDRCARLLVQRGGEVVRPGGQGQQKQERAAPTSGQ